MKKLILTSAVLFSLSGTAIASPVLGDILPSRHALTNSTLADTEDQVFALTDTSGVHDDATAFLLFESAANNKTNTFGIVGSDGAGGLNHLEVFAGVDSHSDFRNFFSGGVNDVTLSWDIGTNEVTNSHTSQSSFIDDQLFGFYIETLNDGIFYSLDSLNTGSLDLMASYFTQGLSGVNGSNFVFGFEDTLYGDLDYNDMVVGISDIRALDGVTTFDNPSSVPEPMPLALMGLGLVGLGYTSRRKTKAA